MTTLDPLLTTHLVRHLRIAYDPEHLALKLSVPADDLHQLSPEAQELFLETVVSCWKESWPQWKLQELLLTPCSEEC